MLSMVKLLLKGEVGVCALNSHGNYIVHHGKSWKNHGIAFLIFCGNPVSGSAHGEVTMITIFCFSVQLKHFKKFKDTTDALAGE